MDRIHSSAARGFASEAATYTRGRPEYPDALLGWLHDSLRIEPGARVLDLGAGTGKFTRLLLRTGAEVIAVEPVAQMRDEFARAVPGVVAQAGTAADIPLPDGACDAVVCAQAFHWFAHSSALAEIHRVLRPGGVLGLVWNVRDESVDWVARISAILAPFEADTPRHHQGRWRAAFEADLFTLPEPASFAHTHEGPAAEVVVDRIMSVSFVAALSEAERRSVRERLEHLVRTHPALAGRATVGFPYRTDAYACARLA